MDRKERDAQIERESRKHHMSDNQGGLSGVLSRDSGDFLKGGSPVPLILQAETEINAYINRHTDDSFGALKQVLQRRIKTMKPIVAQNIDTPLNVLSELITQLFAHDEIYYAFVKEVDSLYGQLFQERPYFQSPGGTPHPEDAYTHESVKASLKKLLARIS